MLVAQPGLEPRSPAPESLGLSTTACDTTSLCCHMQSFAQLSLPFKEAKKMFCLTRTKTQMKTWRDWRTWQASSEPVGCAHRVTHSSQLPAHMLHRIPKQPSEVGTVINPAGLRGKLRQRRLHNYDIVREWWSQNSNPCVTHKSMLRPLLSKILNAAPKWPSV